MTLFVHSGVQIISLMLHSDVHVIYCLHIL